MRAQSLMHLSLAEEIGLIETMEALLRSGTPLATAYAEAAQILDRPCRDAARAIAVGLEQGASIVTAAASVIALHPLHYAALAVADETGDSLTALRHALGPLREIRALRRRTVSAAVYPVSVVLLTIIALVVLIAIVLPRFEALASFGSVDAIVTRATTTIGVVLVVASIAATTLVTAARRATGAGQPSAIDRLFTRAPVVGRFLARADALGVAYATEGLLAAGTGTAEAVRLAAGCARLRLVRHRLHEAADAIDAGATPAVPIGRALAAIPGVQRWLSTAEAGADLRASMQSLAIQLNDDTTHALERIASLTEPVLTAAAGLLVLAVVVTVVRPLFELYIGVLQ